MQNTVHDHGFGGLSPPPSRKLRLRFWRAINAAVLLGPSGSGRRRHRCEQSSFATTAATRRTVPEPDDFTRPPASCRPLPQHRIAARTGCPATAGTATPWASLQAAAVTTPWVENYSVTRPPRRWQLARSSPDSTSALLCRCHSTTTAAFNFKV